ncbi:MAG: EAL domain-containing protein [Burkholderiales bacterium]|nr:MAG: EAL domain-containing protein [Burkholderiales bacterium]
MLADRSDRSDARAALRAFYGRHRNGIWVGALGLSLLGLATSLLVAFGASDAAVVETARSVALLALIAVGVSLLGCGELLRDGRIAARQLTRLQARQRAAEDLAALGSWDYDLARHAFAWSAGACELFGFDIEEPPTALREFVAAIHPEDRPRWVDAHRRAAREGREARVAFRFQRSDRRTVWVRSVARAERRQDRRIVSLSGIVQDVTSMRTLATRLRRSEAKYRDLTEISTDWYWESDTQHRFAYLSPSAASTLGRLTDAAVGRTRRELGAAGSTQVDWDGHEAALSAHAPFDDFVYRTLGPGGDLIWISESGRPLFDARGEFGGYRGIGRNVTRERHQYLALEIERELAEAMREQVGPDQVLDTFLRVLCAHAECSAALYLASQGGGERLLLRSRHAASEAAAAIGALSPALLEAGSVEAQVAHAGQPIWIQDLGAHREFARRYAAEAYGARSALIVPVTEEAGSALGVLVLLSRMPMRPDDLGRQLAEISGRMLSLFLKRSSAEERLVHASLHDPLTGIPNRVYLTHQLEGLLRRREPVAVLYVDLDRFKIINDTLGHSMGDQVLVEIARRLRDSIRDEDIAGRIGGDEFTVLLLGLEQPAQVEPIARAMLAAIEKPVVLMNRAYFLSASIGVAMAPRDGTDAKALIRAADAAMYRVKSEGRNDVQFSSGELSDARTEGLQLAAELPLALQRGEVDLYYQPILSIGERRLTGLEALLRWRHPQRGLLLPDRFVPVAEQSNLIRELGAWALERALQDRLAFGLDRFDDAPVCVNVSARQLREEGFLDTLNRQLHGLGFPPHLLRLELTESSLIENPERVVRLIAEIRRLGVQVIIDSFGTGYASLAYLRNLPVDGIKIDRSFVHGLDSDRGNAAIVEAVVTLARKLSLQPMAEGVETTAELRALRELQCEVLQGELISAPLPAAQLRDFAESLPVLRRLHLLHGGQE